MLNTSVNISAISRCSHLIDWKEGPLGLKLVGLRSKLWKKFRSWDRIGKCTSTAALQHLSEVIAFMIVEDDERNESVEQDLVALRQGFVV